MPSKIEINLLAYPETFKQYEDDALKRSIEVKDGLKTAEEVIDQVETTFDAIRIKRIIHMFEPNKITFKEK